MQFSATMGAIAKALSSFQAEAPNPPKTRTAKVPTKSGGEYSYTYADLADIITAMRPLLGKHGLAVVQSATNVEHGVGVTTLLTHSSGEWIMSDPLILPLQGATAQAAGSAVTYARRYALSAILGISSEDDDDAASATSAQAAHAPQQSAPRPAPRQASPNKPISTNDSAPAHGSRRGGSCPRRTTSQPTTWAVDAHAERLDGGCHGEGVSGMIANPPRMEGTIRMWHHQNSRRFTCKGCGVQHRWRRGQTGIERGIWCCGIIHYRPAGLGWAKGRMPEE